jgi:hypothetical protein
MATAVTAMAAWGQPPSAVQASCARQVLVPIHTQLPTAAELRSAGQPRAAVSTQFVPLEPPNSAVVAS